MPASTETARGRGARTPHDLTIRLERIEDLFTAPQLDPFHRAYHTLSGIERVANHLKGYATRSELRVTFVLAQTPARPDSLTGETQAAIARYCDVMIDNTYAELVARRRRVRNNLLVGLLILGVSLVLGAGVANASLLSNNLRALLGNSISILGTVALWSPVDALLFGLPPLYRTLQLYAALKTLRVAVQVEPPRG